MLFHIFQIHVFLQHLHSSKWDWNKITKINNFTSFQVWLLPFTKQIETFTATDEPTTNSSYREQNKNYNNHPHPSTQSALVSIQVAIIRLIALVIFNASSIATCSIEANLSKESLSILSASSIADTCSVDAMLSRFTLVMFSAGAFLDFFSRQKISLTSFKYWNVDQDLLWIVFLYLILQRPCNTCRKFAKW